MSPMQQIFLGLGAVAKKTFVDDIFSTFLYEGTGSAKTVTTGIDQSGEGSLTWIKKRDGAVSHHLYDTVRGAGKGISCDLTSAEYTLNTRLSGFTSTGFTLGNNGAVNANGGDYTSWTFRKAPGFFDIVAYTGNGSGSARTLNHNLDAIPGFILVKKTSQSGTWTIYHRDLGNNGYLAFNNLGEQTSANTSINSVSSTQFTIGADNNDNNETYIVYLWAGGESTALTSRSVEFDASGDYLNTTTSSSNFTMGTGDFTVEYYFKQNFSNHSGNTFQISDTSGGFKISSFASTISAWTAADDTWKYNAGGSEISTGVKAYKGQWYHVALVRNSGTTSLYINGTRISSTTDNTNYNGTYIVIGGYYSTSYLLDGSLSNFRVVKGTAVYTSSFKPPTEPLTNISGTVLLCLNNASATGSTVTPATLNSYGNPTASTDSPFDDPAGFVFGNAGDQNVIKCGNYVGNGSSSAPPQVYLGWEPQWVMVKRTNGGGQDWVMVDSMRGMFSGLSQTPHLRANSSNAEEDTGYYRIDISSGTGFAPFTTDNGLNGNGDEYIYLAFRRSDGYVGKPPELGTDVFAMDDTSNGLSVFPQFTSGFPVDFSLTREPDVGGTWYSWHTGARLLQGKYQLTATNNTWADGGNFQYDYNDGIFIGQWTDYMSWMWKRHAGFDVVTYKGNGTFPRAMPHSLNAVPEMIWVKSRTNTYNWEVYHKGLNGGTNPEDYHIKLNQTNAASQTVDMWSSTAPNATHYFMGDHAVNANSQSFIAMLFASVDGISKVGSYTGNGSTGQTITLGFQPRFVIIRKYNDASNWLVLDTTRGWGSGDDKYLLLNSTGAQGNYEVGAPVSNGFTLVGDNDYNNSSGAYIYYAHA